MWRVYRAYTRDVGALGNGAAIEQAAAGTWRMWSALNMEEEYLVGHRRKSRVVVGRRAQNLRVDGLHSWVQRCLYAGEAGYCLTLSPARQTA